jgi:hypothetical protein
MKDSCVREGYANGPYLITRLVALYHSLKTPGYCWRTYCHATELRLLLRILLVPGPSMMAYARHNFRHLGVRQQYPPVLCTWPCLSKNVLPLCPETQYRYPVP